jgi:uncharacterized membrane protein YhhN
MKKLALLLFVVIALSELVAIALHKTAVHEICKPLLMVTLIIYYWVAAGGNRSSVLVAALVTSWIGDILLLLAERDERYFIPGLVLFLITHLVFILGFRQHRRKNAGNPLRGVQSIRMAFPVVLAGTGLIVVLYPSLGDLKAPVVAYAVVLMFMVLNALYRYGYTDFKSMIITFAGALLFMVSDSILAVNKFLMPLGNAGLWIMATYVSGQFCIVRGLLYHNKD